MYKVVSLGTVLDVMAGAFTLFSFFFPSLNMLVITIIEFQQTFIHVKVHNITQFLIVFRGTMYHVSTILL